ncbi:acyltransferase family protein [Parvularcula maris]|uniref:Acyltransferase n=1 Tax=Parvularcula maris TaxID=2965077 RepID=A0A9X2L7M2_9PROT|nr:acyltransferase [Parvularcula maris]
MSANRFDAIRLVFAAAVAVYHLVVLASLDSSGELERLLGRFAELSVQGFFILSGALVYGSWQRSASIADYAGKRIRRLYPAYAAVILVPSLIAMLLGGEAGGVARYLAANLAFLNFLHPDLPGLFEGQRFEAVNGSLWTLKIEVMFYIALVILGPLLAWTAERRTAFLSGLLAVFYIGGELWHLGFLIAAEETGRPILAILARQLPGQMAYFTAGMALWHWQQVIRTHLSRVGAAALVLTVLSFFVPEGAFLRPVGLAGVIAWLAWSPGIALPVTRYGDFSYGIYICHFPIIQSLVASGLFEESPALAVAASVLCTLGASVLLWHLVERPALRRTSHYRKADQH